MRSNLKSLYAHQTSAGRAIEDCARLYVSIIRVRIGIGCVVQPHTPCGFFSKLNFLKKEKGGPSPLTVHTLNNDLCNYIGV